MQDSRSRGAPLRIDALPSMLEQPLDNEAGMLDTLVAALAKGQTYDELWAGLHAAAARDDRLAELAFAYEALQQDRRLKLLSPAVQADVLMHAAEFFAGTFGDPDGAESYLERILSTVPAHDRAFAQYAALLEQRGEVERLSNLYATASGHHERDGQLEYLRYAAQLVESTPGQEDNTLKLYQQILKIDPSDVATRGALESRLLAGGKFSDVAKLLEVSLNADPPPDDEEALTLRARLIEIYESKLSEVERAIPHVEEVLHRDPTHERARRVAEQLLTHKAMAARAAAALADVHESLGNANEAARMLTLQVEHLRGPRRLEAQKRLAILLFERLGDISGALPLLEAIVAADPSDDETRARFRTTSAAEGKLAEATRVLTRAATGTKDPVLKARIGSEVGAMYLDLGDEKRARVMFQGVLDGTGDDEAVLRSARALARITTESKEYRHLAGVLDRLSQIEPEPSARAASAERLARLCEEELKDQGGAITAWRRLLDTSLEPQAVASLERLYEATNAHDELIAIIERRAMTTPEPSSARALFMRAASLRVEHTTDHGATLGTLKHVVATYGPARDVHELLIPLCEQERLWPDLIEVLSAELSLVDRETQAGVLVRIAQLQQNQLHDPGAALAAYRGALAIDPTERLSRLALEKMLLVGDFRLEAADVLEDLYRSEQAAAGLTKLLEVRAELAEDPGARLHALSEAAQTAERDLKDAKRALAIVGQGLAESVLHATSQVPHWLTDFERLAASAAPERRAALLVGALGDREIDGDEIQGLARRAAEALVQCGEVAEALAVYRRALAFTPSDAEILGRVDALLKEQGSPEERLTLYRDALNEPCEPTRRRELLHSIGSLQRRDLKDYSAAIATYRDALTHDPNDQVAYAALLEVHAEAEDWEALYQELSQGLSRAEGEGRLEIELRMAEVSVTAGAPARAFAHYRDILGRPDAVSTEVLDTIEALSVGHGDRLVARQVLERRIAMAADSQEEATALERLGDLLLTVGDAAAAEDGGADESSPEDRTSAIDAYKRAARLCEAATVEPERAQRLYERVLELVPSDRETATRLLELYRRSGDPQKVLQGYLGLLSTLSDPAEVTQLLLAMEKPVGEAGAVDIYVERINGAVMEQAEGRLALLGAKARVLSLYPERASEAAATYRLMMEKPGDDDPTWAEDAFDVFLASRADDASFHEDRRWLWDWRVERADEADRIRILLGWAMAEETIIGDPERAAIVYEKVLAVEPDQDDALSARCRLLLMLGDVEAAAHALAARRAHSEGAARVQLDLELAELMLTELDRPGDALDVLESVLESAPTEPAAIEIAKRALDTAATMVRAAKIIERAAENEEQPELSRAHYELLLTIPPSVPELAEPRGRWYERLLDSALEPDAALGVALQAVYELPAEESLWERAERIARETQRPERVAEAYRRLLEQAAPDPRAEDPDGDDSAEAPAPRPFALSPEQVQVIGQRGVEYHEEWFDEPEIVATMLRRILRVAPLATWAFERLKLSYNAAERWDDLFELYDRVLASADDVDTRMDILEDAAQTAKDFAGNADKAIDYFAALLELRPSDSRATAALERLYERMKRYRPLIDLLVTQLAGLEGDEATKMQLRIAGLYIEGLAEPAPAFEHIDAVFENEPDQPEAYSLIEKILALPQESAEEGSVSWRPSAMPSIAPGIVAANQQLSDDGPVSDPSGQSSPPSRRNRKVTVRHRAAGMLKDFYRRTDKPADVARMLAVELESVKSTKDRIRRLKELVTLCRDTLSDDASAFDHLAALVTLDPKVAAYRVELDRLAETTGRHARLSEVLVEVGDRVEDRTLRMALLGDAAAIHRDRLGDRTMAIELQRRVLELADEDPDIALAVARDLDKLLSEAGRVAERVDVLERLAALETEPELRRNALAEVARLSAENLEDPDRAIKAERQRLADDPKDLEALDGLVSALRSRGRFRELVDALEQRASSGPSPADARRDRGEVARLLELELKQPSDAITAWLRIREVHEPDDESCDALGRLLSDAERHDELAEMLEVEIARADAPERAAELSAMMGDVHRDGTQSWEAAAQAYREGLDFSVDNQRARRGLESLIDRLDGDADEASRPVYVLSVVRLAQALEEMKAFSALVELLPPRLSAASDDAARIQILRETAEHQAEQLGDKVGAFDSTFRAFALDATSADVADELVRRARSADRWEVLAAELEPMLESRDDVPSAVARQLWWNLAEWQRDQRMDPAAAELSFQRALATDPESIPLLSALAELQRQSQGRPLVETLLRLSEATGGDLDLLREASEIAMDQVRDGALAHPIVDRMLAAAARRFHGGEAAFAETPMEPSFAGEMGMAAVESAAVWAIDAKIRLCRDDESPAGVKAAYLAGAQLPFGQDQKRSYMLSASELADGDEAIQLLNQLFEQDPEDVRVAGRLEALYRAQNRRGDLLKLRARQVQVAKTPEARAALRLHVAALQIEAEDRGAAITALCQNLEELPSHSSSVMRLAELYELEGRREDLLSLWESQASIADETDPDAAAILWVRAAVLAEEALDNKRRAVTNYQNAVRTSAPESTLDQLARLHVELRDYRSAAEVLEKLCAVTSPAKLPEQILRLCDAYVAAEQPERARARLEKAVETVEAPVLTGRLRELYRADEEWGPLADLLTREAAVAPDRATRLERLREAAELHLSRRDDPVAALPLLEQAADLAPEDLSIRLSVCDALRAAGRFEDATGILKALVAAYGGRRPKDRALVHYELARVSLSVGDRAKALGELDVAVKIDPSHPEILHSIARLALEEGQLARAQRMYRALLLVVRSTRAEARRGASAVSQAEVLVELSDIAERQGEPERSIEFMESAFEAAADKPDEADKLVASLRQREKHATLARAIEVRLESDITTKVGAALWNELADIYDHHLDRPKDALAVRLKALTLRPGSAEAHEQTLTLARKLEEVPQYLEALTSMIEAVRKSEVDRSAEAVELLLIKGRILEEELSEDKKAAEVYRQAEELLESSEQEGPAFVRFARVWRALEALYGRLGDIDEQANVLQKLAEGVESDPEVSAEQKVAPLYRLAALRFQNENTHDDACSLLERAMELDPEIDRAEAQVRASIDVVPAEIRVLRLFEDFCRKHERRRSLVDALTLVAEHEGADSPAWREAVDTAVALEDGELAEALLRKVLTRLDEAQSSDDADAVWALKMLSDRRLEAEDVAEAAALRERAGRAAPPDEERQLLLSVAELCAGPLEDTERAAAIYRELLEREPADRELWEPLMKVYRQTQQTDKLAELIQATVVLVDDLTERGKLRFELANIVLASDPEKATILLHEILEEDASQADAAALLSQLLTDAGRIEDLIAVLHRQLDAAKDAEDKNTVIAVSMQLGELLEQRDQEDDALDIYHAALDWDARSRAVLRAVVRLNIKRDDSIDLGDSLEKLLSVEEGKEAVSLALQLAGLRRTHGDDAGAEAALLTGYRACPESVELRDELVKRFTEREAWPELAEVYLLDGTTREEASERSQLLLMAAEVYRDHAQDGNRAAEVVELALSSDPSDRDLLYALIETVNALGQPERAVKALTIAIDAVTEDDPWLFHARASMYSMMRDAENALLDLERAYAASGGHYATEYATHLEHAAQKALEAGDVARDRELRLRLCEVLGQSGEVDQARHHLSELAKRDPRDREVLRALAVLEESAGRWDGVSAAYRKLIAIEEGEDLVTAALRLADACEKAGRPGDARGGLERALRTAPSNDEVRASLRRVYEATQAYRELAELTLDQARAAADVDGRYEHLIEAGRLLLRSEDDGTVAIEVLEEATGLKPEEQACSLLLAEAYARGGRRAEAVNLLLGLVSAFKGRRSPRLAPVYETMARLELRDGNMAEALATMVKAFENDPSNHKLALELGTFAVDMRDAETANRAFRAVTMMKTATDSKPDGPTGQNKALAYFHLGQLASEQGDRRKARLMLEKAVSEDADLQVARDLLEVIRQSP